MRRINHHAFGLAGGIAAFWVVFFMAPILTMILFVILMSMIALWCGIMGILDRAAERQRRIDRILDEAGNAGRFVR